MVPRYTRRGKKKKKERRGRGFSALDSFERIFVAPPPTREDPPRNWDRRKWIDGGAACFEIGTIIP